MRLSAPTLVECGNCGNLIMTHAVCPKCGFYRGRQVITPEANG
jgi:large subunit ribosomal protein L32